MAKTLPKFDLAKAVVYNASVPGLGIAAGHSELFALMVAEWQANHDLVVDGWYGPKTRDSLSTAFIIINSPSAEWEPTVDLVLAPSQPAVHPVAPHSEGTKWNPTPNPAVWTGWFKPMPTLHGGHTPDVSSGFAQYEKGPNARDRPNHWGIDYMYRRWEGDEGIDGVKKMGNGYYRGVKHSPTHSPWW